MIDDSFAPFLKKRKPYINITSLVDVMFILLLFFIVCTTFTRFSSLKVSLPKVSGQVAPENNKSVDVLITSDQQITINGSKLSFEQVEGKVKEVLAMIKDENAPVSFKVDEKVSYGFAMEVMGKLKSAGAKTILAITDAGFGANGKVASRTKPSAGKNRVP
jgi:biopolymer transport protein ExbD